MGTPYQKIYDSFLAKVKEDEWSDPSELDYHIEDWKALLNNALPYFKFPRFSLNRDDALEEFEDELNQDEIEIIASLMKKEWIDRQIYAWDQVKTMYDERDFSQANMLAQLIKASNAVTEKNRHLQKNYSRSILGSDGRKKPFDYSIFGGSK